MYRYDPEIDKWSSQPREVNIKYPSTKTLAVVTWNLDFSKPRQSARLVTALNHLQVLLEPLSHHAPPVPAIIMIQELHHTCLATLLEHPFIKQNYDVTDIAPTQWKVPHYGTITLVPQSLPVVATSRTAFKDSRMGRDVLCVDIAIALAHATAGDDVKSEDVEHTGGVKVIRMANTHLESLRGHADKARPKQLATVASLLSAPEVHGGLVGGDMNPIGPLDDRTPENLNLVDAWMFCKQPKLGENDGFTVVPDPEEVKRREAEGNTWGYQPPSRYYPRRRMDKVLFIGNLTVKDIEKVGVGLKVNSDIEKERVWASDHYGLLAKLEVL